MNHSLHVATFALVAVSAGCSDKIKPQQEITGFVIDARDLDEIRASAEEGDAEAQYKLGLMYDAGQVVTQNKAEAVKWYRLAAEQEYARAQNNLGTMYFYGTGVPQNSAEGAKWYRLAAEQGISEAQFNLGVMYDDGEGVPKDYAESYHWLLVASSSGDADANQLLGGVARKLTPEELSQAQQRSTELLEKLESGMQQ